MPSNNGDPDLNWPPIHHYHFRVSIFTCLFCFRMFETKNPQNSYTISTQGGHTSHNHHHSLLFIWGSFTLKKKKNHLFFWVNMHSVCVCVMQWYEWKITQQPTNNQNQNNNTGCHHYHPLLVIQHFLPPYINCLLKTKAELYEDEQTNRIKQQQQQKKIKANELG